jgi:hypothetical protein
METAMAAASDHARLSQLLVGFQSDFHPNADSGLSRMRFALARRKL